MGPFLQNLFCMLQMFFCELFRSVWMNNKRRTAEFGLWRGKFSSKSWSQQVRAYSFIPVILQWCLWRQEEISWSWFWHILADFFPSTFTGKAIANLCILEDIFRFAFPSIFGANRILLQYTVFESDPLVLLIELKYMWPWMMKGTCGVNKIVWAKINGAQRNKFCNFCIERYSTIHFLTLKAILDIRPPLAIIIIIIIIIAHLLLPNICNCVISTTRFHDRPVLQISRNWRIAVFLEHNTTTFHNS